MASLRRDPTQFGLVISLTILLATFASTADAKPQPMRPAAGTFELTPKVAVKQPNGKLQIRLPASCADENLDRPTSSDTFSGATGINVVYRQAGRQVTKSLEEAIDEGFISIRGNDSTREVLVEFRDLGPDAGLRLEVGGDAMLGTDQDVAKAYQKMTTASPAVKAVIDRINARYQAVRSLGDDDRLVRFIREFDQQQEWKVRESPDIEPDKAITKFDQAWQQKLSNTIQGKTPGNTHALLLIQRGKALSPEEVRQVSEATGLEIAHEIPAEIDGRLKSWSQDQSVLADVLGERPSRIVVWVTDQAIKNALREGNPLQPAIHSSLREAIGPSATAEGLDVELFALLNGRRLSNESAADIARVLGTKVRPSTGAFDRHIVINTTGLGKYSVRTVDSTVEADSLGDLSKALREVAGEGSTVICDSVDERVAQVLSDAGVLFFRDFGHFAQAPHNSYRRPRLIMVGSVKPEIAGQLYPKQDAKAVARVSEIAKKAGHALVETPDELNKALRSALKANEVPMILFNNNGSSIRLSGGDVALEDVPAGTHLLSCKLFEPGEFGWGSTRFIDLKSAIKAFKSSRDAMDANKARVGGGNEGRAGGPPGPPGGNGGGAGGPPGPPTFDDFYRLLRGDYTELVGRRNKKVVIGVFGGLGTTVVAAFLVSDDEDEDEDDEELQTDD